MDCDGYNAVLFLFAELWAVIENNALLINVVNTLPQSLDFPVSKESGWPDTKGDKVPVTLTIVSMRAFWQVQPFS